jgi:hypothetical protein
MPEANSNMWSVLKGDMPQAHAEASGKMLESACLPGDWGDGGESDHSREGSCSSEIMGMLIAQNP